MKTVLGRKKNTTNDKWREVFKDIEKYISKEEVDIHVKAKVAEISSLTAGKNCAIAWSGGKDSLVVERLANMAGIKKGVFAHTSVEYPAFMQWVAEHKAKEIEAINSGHSIEWIKKHPQFLFPKTTALHSRWYGIVQQATVRKYYKQNNLDLILYGRRKADGNFVPEPIYTNGKGVTIYNCIAEWPHELLLGFIHYYNIPLPPIYDWENGFVEGTHSWCARNPEDKKDMTAWKEIYNIDPSIVENAANHFESAKQFLKERGLLN